LATLATGMFGLLGLAPSPFWWVLIGIGVGSTVGALALTGRGVVRTRYRPDRWDLAAWLVTGSGLVAAIGTFLADPTNLNPTVVPLVWPQADPVALTALAVATAPAVMAPTRAPTEPRHDRVPPGQLHLSERGCTDAGRRRSRSDRRGTGARGGRHGDRQVHLAAGGERPGAPLHRRNSPG